MGLRHILPIRVKVELREMAMKGHSILLKAPELEPHPPLFGIQSAYPKPYRQSDLQVMCWFLFQQIKPQICLWRVKHVYIKESVFVHGLFKNSLLWNNRVRIPLTVVCVARRQKSRKKKSSFNGKKDKDLNFK